MSDQFKPSIVFAHGLALDARDHLDPPWTRSRRHLLDVVITANTIVKTMPAHGGHHASRLRLPECGGRAPLT